MRIVSLVPSATEILFALGLGSEVVGVSHACDFPPEARSKPALTSSALDDGLSSQEIDTRVAETAAEGAGVYRLDVDLLARLAPDVIFTQGVCAVCAVPHGVVRRAVPKLPSRPHVYSLDPTTIGDLLSNIKTVGDATGRQARARELIVALRARIDAVSLRAAAVQTLPRVLCLEWLDPPWTAGHWVPEMVGLAGGLEIFGGIGQTSRRVTWTEVARLAPEVVVLMPCGFDLRRTLDEWTRTAPPPAWGTLPAVRAERVYAVNGSAYFNRPGPRLVDGLELLAWIIQPERSERPTLPDAVRHLTERD